MDPALSHQSVNWQMYTLPVQRLSLRRQVGNKITPSVAGADNLVLPDIQLDQEFFDQPFIFAAAKQHQLIAWLIVLFDQAKFLVTKLKMRMLQ